MLAMCMVSARCILSSFSPIIITLTAGILGHDSQINTLRISVYIFRTIKASPGKY